MRKFLNQSFRNRLAAALLLVSLLPLLVCSLSMVQIIRLRMNSSAESEAEEQLQNMRLAMDRLYMALGDSRSVLEGNRAVQNAMAHSTDGDTAVYDLLFTTTSEYRDWASFSLYNLEGQCLYTTGTSAGQRNLSPNWGILHAARNAEGASVFMPEEDPSNREKDILHSAAALRDEDGAPVGYLVMEMFDSDLSALLEGSYGSQNNIWILSRFWELIYGSKADGSEGLAASLRQQLLEGSIPGGDSENFIFHIVQHPDTGLYLVLQQHQMFSRNTMRLLYTATITCALICVVISVVMCLVLSNQIFRPVQRLQKAISRVGQDDFEVHIPENSHDELGQLAKDFNDMVSALKRNREELVENHRELNQAQIRMLQAQLNPHFLCNTLDTMKWISKINHVPQVATMATDLADILRLCISDEEFIPLYREIDVLDRYIEIQKLRLSGSFQFRVDIPADLESCMIPKMILQPIVENAVLHGISGIDNSEIRVYAVREGNRLRLTVEDNGKGFPQNMGKAAPLSREGHHLGLHNVNTILIKHYGTESQLQLSRGIGGTGAGVSFTLPVYTEEEPL